MDAAAGRCEALLDRGGRGVDMMSDVAKAPASSRRAVRRMCTAPPFLWFARLRSEANFNY